MRARPQASEVAESTEERAGYITLHYIIIAGPRPGQHRYSTVPKSVPSQTRGCGPCHDTRVQWRSLPKASRSSAHVTRPPYSGPVERVASNISHLPVKAIPNSFVRACQKSRHPHERCSYCARLRTSCLPAAASASPPTLPPDSFQPVSYTHLTLPTICSV